MKLPKYVQAWVDSRDSRAYYYLRRRGYPRVRLPGLPWSPSFMAAYESALTGPRTAIGAGRIKPGSVAAVVAEYLDSQQFFGWRGNMLGIGSGSFDPETLVILESWRIADTCRALWGRRQCTGNAVWADRPHANPSLPVFPADGPKPYNGTRSPVASFRRQRRRTAHD
jgi:hypothetical protein